MQLQLIKSNLHICTAVGSRPTHSPSSITGVMVLHAVHRHTWYIRSSIIQQAYVDVLCQQGFWECKLMKACGVNYVRIYQLVVAFGVTKVPPTEGKFTVGWAVANMLSCYWESLATLE